MGIAIVLLALAAAAGGFFWWRSREPAEDFAHAARVRTGTLAPKPAEPKPEPERRPPAKHRFFIWRLRANATPCDMGRQVAGRLAETDTNAPPPLPSCGQVNCCCHYELIPDQRKGARRKAEDRRDGVRFEEKTDRRKKRDRRRGAQDLWKGPNER